MRVIYGPQENLTPNSEFKKLYESISDQVDIGKENNQQIIILGDFNAKIGNYIKNNKETITKGGRHLKRLLEKGNLRIRNGESNKYKGLQTRGQGEEKSVIDYVITTKRDLNTIKTMKIDEEKEFEICKVERQGTKKSRKIYSDHNAIMLNIDFISKTEAKDKKIITKKGCQKYKKFTEQRQISKITKKGTLQESYNKWAEETGDAFKQVEKTVKKKKKRNRRKDLRELQKIRKNLRRTIKNMTDACEKRTLKNSLKLLKEHITDKIKEGRGNRIKQIAESINNNIDNGRKICAVERKVKRKDETPNYIINSEGRKIENKEQILKEYQKYYQSLLQARPPKNLQEEIIEQEIIDDEPKVEGKEITQLEVKKSILKMKNNKSGDRSRWKAE